MIKVRVRFYAGLRHRVGVSEVTLELPDGARVEHAVKELVRMFPGALMGYAYWVARDGLQVSLEDELRDGDELVVLPPISGG